MNISVIEFMEFLEFYRNFVSAKSPNFYFLLETKFRKGTKASLKKSERQQRIHNIAIGNATWQRKIEDSACLMSHSIPFCCCLVPVPRIIFSPVFYSY